MEHTNISLNEWSRTGERISFNLQCNSDIDKIKKSLLLIEYIFRIITHYGNKYAEEYYIKHKHDLDYYLLQYSNIKIEEEEYIDRSNEWECHQGVLHTDECTCDIPEQYYGYEDKEGG